MKSKLLKTLDILISRGIYGIHSFELMKLSGTTRCAARVNDLKKKGYIIESRRETLGGVEGCRYTLRGKREGAVIKERPITQYRFVGDVAIPIYA